MTRYIKVSEQELTQLIRHSAGRALKVTIPNSLVDTDASPWALPLLEMWRGASMHEGAGI